MKHTVAVLALLGLLTKDQVTAHYLEAEDWDDLLDSKIFNNEQYTNDNPDGYTSAVEEVFQEKEAVAQKK